MITTMFYKNVSIIIYVTDRSILSKHSVIYCKGLILIYMIDEIVFVRISCFYFLKNWYCLKLQITLWWILYGMAKSILFNYFCWKDAISWIHQQKQSRNIPCSFLVFWKMVHIAVIFCTKRSCPRYPLFVFHDSSNLHLFVVCFCI